jgi:hypothetical protein
MFTFIILPQVFRNARLVRKEGADPEYLDDELNDLAVSALLKRTYNTFKLFNGTLEGLYQQTQDLPKFRESLVNAFAKVIPTLTADDADLFGTMDGIHFLSVNKNVFLQIQSFVNSVESSFDQIKNTVFMFRDHMVWSGLEQEDMRALYKYFVRTPTSPARKDPHSDAEPILFCIVRMIKESRESFLRSKWGFLWAQMMLHYLRR